MVLPLSLLLTGCMDREVAQGMLAEFAVRGFTPSARQMTTLGFVEVLPGVRINRDILTVEFDAAVAMDCHDPETPVVYLEVVCCTPDTREHEALVVTSVQPSSIHAALLALGGEPGHPGGWRREGDDIIPVAPLGTPVRVWFLVAGEHDTTTLTDPAQWIVHHKTRAPMDPGVLNPAWVFAGSRLRRFQGREVYDADGTGQLIGLHTFGSETIAWTHIESPEAAVDEPQWLANNDLVPPIGTPVRVRLELAPDR